MNRSPGHSPQPPSAAFDDAVRTAAARSSLTRRRFHRWLALFATILATLFGRRGGLGGPAEAASTPGGGDGASPTWGMTIDLDRCTGCGSCVVACRTENNVAIAGPDAAARGTGIEWMELLATAPDTMRNGFPEILPLPCMHCDNPPCVKVCPTNATYRTEDGIVAQIWDRCIGCRYCQVACPYGRRYFNWAEPEWPESHLSFLNPDVATRPAGVVEKCTFCHHRLRKLRETAALEGRSPNDEALRRMTACAQVCPAEAITFGDLGDATSLVARRASSPRAFRLLEHLGTRPKVIYLARDRRMPE